MSVWTGEQQRRLVPLRMDRRKDRDVDVACRAFEHLRGFTLAPGRHRVDVEIIGIAGKVRRDRSGSLDTRSRRHRRDNDVGVRDSLGRRRGEPRADLLAGLLQCRAASIREQNIPYGDVLDAGFAQA